MIHPGTQEKIISETTSGAGSTERESSIQSDSLVATLWVDSVTSGSLSVSVYTETEEGKSLLLFTFPTISAPTTELVLKKSGVSMSRFRIVATYTGICQYEVYVRAINGIGESNVRILGGNGFRVSKQSVGTSAVQLVPASLTDRTGIIIKNWSLAGNLYLAETSVKATSNDGYPVAPRDNVTLDVAAGVEVWAISDSGTLDIRLGEAGN